MRLYGYWRSSSSYRVRIAVEYKGLAVQHVPVHLLREGGEQHRPDFAERNPLEQVPVLEIEHHGTAISLSQSLAIIEYLEEQHPEPPLLPRDPVQRAKARQLAEVVNSGIQPYQNLRLQQEVAARLPGVDAREFSARWVALGLSGLEQLALRSAGQFMVGNAPTVADVCLVPQLYAARRLAVPLDGYPTLLRVEAECNGLDSFQRAHPSRQPDAEPN